MTRDGYKGDTEVQNTFYEYTFIRVYITSIHYEYTLVYTTLRVYIYEYTLYENTFIYSLEFIRNIFYEFVDFEY